MTEKQFQRQVLQQARLCGWRVAHFGNTVKFVKKKEGGWRTVPDPDASGYPDLTLVRKGRLVFAELKAKTGRLSEAQRFWLDDLAETGQEVYLWNEDDQAEIDRVLR